VSHYSDCYTCVLEWLEAAQADMPEGASCYVGLEQDGLLEATTDSEASRELYAPRPLDKHTDLAKLAAHLIDNMPREI
jgi:hypothetical protein